MVCRLWFVGFPHFLFPPFSQFFAVLSCFDRFSLVAPWTNTFFHLRRQPLVQEFLAWTSQGNVIWEVVMLVMLVMLVYFESVVALLLTTSEVRSDGGC